MVTKEMYDNGTRCKGMCNFCRENVDNCYQYIMDVKGTKKTKEESTMKRVNCYEALQAIFKDNKQVLVRHHCNGIDVDEIWKLGKNIAMMSDIKVSVLYHGEFYILD